jgi:CPA2 family monovalent cation:H+ antiporter-2
MMVGPSGLGLVVQMKRIDTLAEIGASLILFVQGLEFDSSVVQRFKSLSMWNFFTQICVNGVMFTLISYTLLGHDFKIGETLLLVVSSGLCSSTVAVNLATDYNLHHGNFFSILGAMLVGQDLMMGLFLCLPEALSQGFLGLFVVVRQLLYAVVLVSGFIYISARIVPITAKFFLKAEVPQLFLLSTLSACLAGAFVTSSLGLSAEFGALFSGVALTRTSMYKESLSRIESTKNLFSVLLFSSIGMLISPSFIYHNARIIGLLFASIFTIKFVTSFMLLRTFSQNFVTSTLVALSVSQIAEFSMLLAGKGYVMGLIERSNYLIFLTVAVTTLFFNPLIFKLAMSFACLKTQSVGRMITLSNSNQLPNRHTASE